MINLYLNWKLLESRNETSQAINQSQEILGGYQNCIELLKSETARASLYYKKYLEATTKSEIEYAEVNPGDGSGNSGTKH